MHNYSIDYSFVVQSPSARCSHIGYCLDYLCHLIIKKHLYQLVLCVHPIKGGSCYNLQLTYFDVCYKCSHGNITLIVQTLFCVVA